MSKILALAFLAAALSACSSMNSGSGSMGNAAETRNSTDANKSGNRSAVSPGGGGAAGGGTSGASGAGTGTGSGSGSGR